MTLKNNNFQDSINSNSTQKCCESGCEDCPWDFKHSEIDPDIPRELQLDQKDLDYKDYELIDND